MEKLRRRHSIDQARTRWPFITGVFLFLLAVLFSVNWYRVPELSNPTATLPQTDTSVLLPEEAVVVSIFVDELRADRCAVYTTDHESLGSSWNIQDVVRLARAAAKKYPNHPFIIKADVAVPSGLVQATLDAIREEGAREVFFQSDLDTSYPERVPDE